MQKYLALHVTESSFFQKVHNYRILKLVGVRRFNNVTIAEFMYYIKQLVFQNIENFESQIEPWRKVRLVVELFVVKSCRITP